MSELFGDEPKGYRDLWWCWVGKEPFISSYDKPGPDRVFVCSVCGWKSDTQEPDANFRSQHQFMKHIWKPKPNAENGGVSCTTTRREES